MDVELGDHVEDNKHNVVVGWRNIILAYKTLGVVFGGLATSPLYVFNALNFKAPTEDDFLGIFSIMFWTLTMIGFVKYVCIALNADDNGEGGTFALYSLLCKNANIGILKPKNTDSKTLPDNSRNIESKSWLQTFIEENLIFQRVLLFIAILGMCMLIGDGILTPAISVLSAVDGLRGPLPSVSKSAVEGLSAGILIALFMLQKYGTSKVSFLFSPIMAAWTLSTPMVGVYSFCRYNPTVFKAMSPHYIVDFFIRNGKTGWHLLGGTVLVITGAEAMFADLGHFNKRAIQIAFLCGVYPSLVLTYAGQTAYLMKHLNDYTDGFYKFIPTPVYWPMFIIATLTAIVASQSLISAAFSVIKQSVALDYFPRVKIVHTSKHNEGAVYSPETNYILMVLCVSVILGFGSGKEIGNAFGLVVIFVMFITTILLTLVMIIIWRTPIIFALLYFVSFSILEGVYISSVLIKFTEGGWLPFAISMVLAIIMFGWYYGRQRKLDYERTNKITVDHLSVLLSNSEVQRVPGMCFFYSNIEDGLTPLLGHYIKNGHSLHNVAIIATLKCLLIAHVDSSERFSVKKLGIPGVYGCIVKYGYADLLDMLEGDDFVTAVTKILKTCIEENTDQLPISSIEEEILQLEQAKSVGTVHVQGKAKFHVSEDNSWFDKLVLGLYEFLHKNCRSALPALWFPLNQRMEIGMLYKI
ncbi:probable potassium transporter 17 isoform X2 [Dioscorea cayenensis subsp. rotundata]|uniref:Potassium transporter n=1 Tax=Dioscorea cayennensis subsp. rotundata TaxID=55577 RepID=A0AB40CYF0_DIOCR|nr:probable potassium transporter 17 isoform X2 [Dioscorea cayenensis subsp. rotundata]